MVASALLFQKCFDDCALCLGGSDIDSQVKNQNNQNFTNILKYEQ